MKYYLWYFVAVLFISGLLDMITGYFLLCIVIGLLLFICWQYQAFSKLFIFLQGEQGVCNPVQLNTDKTNRLADYLRDDHQSQPLPASDLKRFQETTGALPDAVIVLTEQAAIEWANEKACEYMGIKCPEDVGLRLSNLIRYPELIAYINSKNHQLNKGLQIISPVNTELTLEVRISTYGDTQKLLVARDITAISRINQMRKDFIANASHELRTPLTVIAGYLESFVDDKNCPTEWVTYLEQMRSQTARMQYLIEDLMQLSVLEADFGQVKKELVAVPDILLTIVNEAKSLKWFMNHQIRLNANSGLYLKASQQEIYSAFSNLIFNAVQYTPAYGCIDISWYEDDEGAHCSVQDNGLGIASEHLPRLTERFYRIDKSRSREKGGTGLGLAIVKHVLARHDGNLLIDSTLNKGSLFRCDLPKNLVIHAKTSTNLSV